MSILFVIGLEIRFCSKTYFDSSETDDIKTIIINNVKYCRALLQNKVSIIYINFVQFYVMRYRNSDGL